VAIYRLLQKSAFDPEDIKRMGAAYEGAVCTKNSVRVDLVIELPNVSDDGRAVRLSPDAVRFVIQVFVIQVEEPT
jgi:hypothetical protein